MSDSDLLKKMLRAVLQSNKDGVSVTRLQSDYRSLTGEFIPHKQLGYASLEACLRGMPSVVRMENRLEEVVKCFAVDPAPASLTSPVLVPADVRAKLKELLSKYSQGLWAHALPKLFMDTYKTPFPTDVLANLSLLLDICTVEYPLPDNKDKAILYAHSWCVQRKQPSAVPLPPLRRPSHRDVLS